MREIERNMPECGGLKRNGLFCEAPEETLFLPKKPPVSSPEDVILVYVEDEEEELCEYCGEEISGSSPGTAFFRRTPGSSGDWYPKEKYIRYVFEGKERCCCEKCFWGLIEEDAAYEDAIMILRNRLPGETGIPAVDERADELIEQLEAAYMAELKHKCALYDINRIKGAA